jgi:hypothetical protein
MQSEKRVHLQQFDIIHLPNSNLIHIRNLERNKIMQESFSILYFFFHPPTYRETLMATMIRMRINACGEVSFVKFLFFPS